MVAQTSGGAVSNRTMIAYVSCAGSKQIMVFAMQPATGDLVLQQVASVPGTGEPSPSNMPLAVSPDRRFLYAALRTPPYPVSSFAIDAASGQLTWRSTTPLADPMAYLATDRTGRTLLAASYKGGRLAAHPIIDGDVGAEAVWALAQQPKAHCILPGRRNDVVYATVLGADRILRFGFDPATGVLTPGEPAAVASRAGAGPRHLALHPDQDTLYAINELDGTVDTWHVDPASGALALRGTVGLMPPGFQGNARAADIHITPDGRLLFASVRSTSMIVAFAVDPRTGEPSRLMGTAVGESPRGFAIADGGRFLVAGSQEADVIDVHAIDPGTGGLAPVGRHATGGNPSWIEFVTLGAGA